jgi:hypothetical protein
VGEYETVEYKDGRMLLSWLNPFHFHSTLSKDTLPPRPNLYATSSILGFKAPAAQLPTSFSPNLSSPKSLEPPPAPLKMLIAVGVKAYKKHQRSKEAAAGQQAPSGTTPSPPEYGRPQTSLNHPAGQQQQYLSTEQQGYGADAQKQQRRSISPAQYTMTVSEEERDMILELRRRKGQPGY